MVSRRWKKVQDRPEQAEGQVLTIIKSWLNIREHPPQANNQPTWPKTSVRKPDLRMCCFLYFEQPSCPCLESRYSSSRILICGMCSNVPRGSRGFPPWQSESIETWIYAWHSNIFSWKLLQVFTVLETILLYSKEIRLLKIERPHATQEICPKPVRPPVWPRLTLAESHLPPLKTPHSAVDYFSHSFRPELMTQGLTTLSPGPFPPLRDRQTLSN